MTVKDLRKALEAFPDNFEVVLSSDPEGNGYHPLGEVTEQSVEDGEVWDEGNDVKANAAVFWPGYWKRS